MADNTEDTRKRRTESSSGSDGPPETKKKNTSQYQTFEYHDRRICNYGTIGNVATGDGHSGEIRTCINNLEDNQQNMAHFLKAWTDGMVETAAFKKVMEMLDNGSTWITIKGSPGEGKTTVSYMALRELQKSGRQVFQAWSPEEFTEITKACPRPVILLDDLFGQLEFDQTAWQKWKHIFQKVLNLREHRSHKPQPTEPDTNIVTVLLVGRNYVFNPASVQIGRLCSIILQDFTSVVDMSHTLGRTVEEKQKIWNALVGPSGIKISQNSLLNIFQHIGGHGFPHVCRLFVTIRTDNPNLSAEKFFKAPLQFLNETVTVFLQSKPRLFLFKEMLKKQGKISERDLEVAGGDVSLVQCAKELVGSYLKMEFDYFVFDHPSIYDSVAFNICKSHTMFVIQNCKLAFIHERLRLDGDEVSESPSSGTDLVVYISPHYVTDLAQRFAKELLNSRNWFLILSHQACTQQVFVKEMVSQLSVPLKELLSMVFKDYDISIFYRDAYDSDFDFDNGEYSFYRILGNTNSSQLLKYIDTHTDIHLTQPIINDILYGVFESAASDVLSYLLQSPRHTVNMNVRYGYRKTPLMIAAESNDSQFVQKVLSLDPDLKPRDKSGRRALHYLCMSDMVAAVSHVIDKVGHIDKRDREGNSPLSTACIHNRKNVVTLLLERGAQIDTTSVRMALWYADEEIFKTLFDRLKRQEMLDGVFDDIFYCGRSCEITRVLNRLLQVLCDQRDKENFSDLLTEYLGISCKHNDVEILRLLLELGASVNGTFDGSTPLHIACERHCPKAIQFLIDHGADVNERDSLDRTPLLSTILSYSGSMECFQLLLKAGADRSALVKYRSDDGNVLHALARHNDTELKQLIEGFVKDGLDVNEQTKEGRTALHVALYSPKYEPTGVIVQTPDFTLCQKLIELGADVNIRDTQGNTPLHLLCRVRSYTHTTDYGTEACESCIVDYKSVVELLLKQRASVNIPNDKGQSALRGFVKNLWNCGMDDESESEPESELCETGTETETESESESESES